MNVPWVANGRLKAGTRWVSLAGDWLAGAHVGISLPCVTGPCVEKDHRKTEGPRESTWEARAVNWVYGVWVDRSSFGERSVFH